ncbi:MAG: SsrA-binding protein SmpB [Coriobacteriales bacterium]|nr:SsrA-binding protein SmpB [Coriobacteriales bacterium]
MASEEKLIAKNKQAFFEYFIDETFEAGVVLTGTEVKSLRENRTSLRDAFATIRKSEAWLHNVHIAAYSHGNRSNVDPDRTRKLLMHKREIRYLIGKTKEKGFTLVPLKMYFDANGRVKIELGLGRGKKLHDKRQTLAERDHKRDVERALRERQKGV